MASLLEQAFEPDSLEELDLYKDVLQCSRDSTPAQLRKAYYKQAKQYHPDKNDSETAKVKFQAISWTYNYLKDPTKRQEYDQEGVIPREDEDYDDDDDNHGKKSWKDYFDLIFGKLSTDDIDNFAMKYKMSEEEEKDVLENYTKFQGNLVKMLEYVMLSEERDVPRWIEDYIQPAIAAGKVEKYDKALKKAMAQIDKKLAKENGKNKKESKTKKKAAPKDDPDETETEESDNDAEDTKPKAAKAAKKAAPPKKAKPTKTKSTKKKSKASSDADLVAMIRNKKGRVNPLTSIAARYGVSGDFEDDPLDDAAFAKIQSNMKKRKK